MRLIVHRQKRVINGEKTFMGEMTYAAQINKRGACVPYCSGSILSKTFILTAAHCLHDKSGWTSPREMSITIGAKFYHGCDGVKHEVLRHFYPRDVYRVGRGTGDIGLIQVKYLIVLLFD